VTVRSVYLDDIYTLAQERASTGLEVKDQDTKLVVPLQFNTPPAMMQRYIEKVLAKE
jgi:hypothetical protein